MNKRNDLETGSEFEYSDDYFEKILEEMENDPEFQNFTVPDEWDREFRKTIEETLKKEKRKKMKRYVKIGTMAACAVLAVTAGLNMRMEEVQGEGLLEVFQNTFNLNQNKYMMYGSDEDFGMDFEEEDTEDIVFEADTLSEIYDQMRQELKRPMFYTEDVFGEYEIKEARYNATYHILNIELETSEGSIFFSQEQEPDAKSLGGMIDDEESEQVYNKNLDETIMIYKSDQSSFYIFSINEEQNTFIFQGSISLDCCKKLAESVSFH